MIRPTCEMCAEIDGQVVAATVVDHRVPHRGNQQLFEFGELISLCKHHHDSLKRRLEGTKPIIRIDEHGCPHDESEALRSRWMFVDEERERWR